MNRIVLSGLALFVGLVGFSLVGTEQRAEAGLFGCHGRHHGKDCHGGLLARLHARKSCHCEPAPECEPAPCCEAPACEPAPCCEAPACEPTCCEAPKKHCRLFGRCHRKSSCCEPAPCCESTPSCGCEMAAPATPGCTNCTLSAAPTEAAGTPAPTSETAPAPMSAAPASPMPMPAAPMAPTAAPPAPPAP